MKDFKPFRLLFSCILALFIISCTGIVSAHAATINVTANATDTLNGADGQCSLREAITNINNSALTYADCANSGAAYGTSDTINIPSGTYTTTLAGGEDLNASGDYDILINMSLVGAGASTTIIDGGAIERVFYIPGPSTVSISGVTIQNGNGPGGGIHNNHPGNILTVTSSTISGNSAVGASGGGIYNGGTLTVTNSTISGNSETNMGGGISNFGTLTVTNSTISGNSATNGAAGILNWGTFTVTNSTIVKNTANAGTGGGIWSLGGGSLTNSIVADNGVGLDCGGTIIDSGGNIDSDGSCNTFTQNAAMVQGTGFSALAGNGGPTQTHALLAGSAAIDAAPACAGLTTDQRGNARPAGSACDIGAYEYPAYTVTPSAGAGGTVAPNTSQTINYGSTTQFTVTPNAGYTALVGGTCGGALVGTTYTTNAITANCTVSASFTLNTYTVTPSAGAGGTIAPNTPQTINHGSTTAFTVTPNAGYTASVGGTCGGALVGTTYTTNVITANCTVSATFAATAPACSYSISPTSKSFDLSGGTGTVTVTAPDGCAWTAASNASWAGITSGSSGSGNGTVSFTVAANSGAGRTSSLTIAGNSFTIDQAGVEYTLVVTKSGTGLGSIYKLYAPNSALSMFSELVCGADCRVNTRKYSIGAEVFLYAVPATGTTFVGWSGGGCSGTGICTATLNADTSVNAAFAPVATPITDSATTTLTTTGSVVNVNVPVVKYVNSSNGTTTYYSTEFVYMPTSDNKLWLKLAKADILTDISLYNGAQLSQLYQIDSGWRLHLTTIEYNGESLWADLEYIPSNDGILWFVITGSGTN